MQLILLHGLGQAPSAWEKTVGAMSMRERVVCPDLSDMLRGGEVSYPRLYRAFSEYCGAFSEPPALCGLSLGGILALHYAIGHPSGVRSLALIGARLRMPRALLAVQAAAFRLMPRSMFAQTGFDKEAFLALTSSMANLDFRGDAEKASCPALILCGERDRANRRAAVELAERLPNAKLRIVERAGHEVNIDAPEKLAGILDAFFTARN